MMVFQLSKPFTLVIAATDVIASFQRFSQVGVGAAEAGGVILGLRRGPHYEILDVTLPQPSDFRSRFSFVRRERPHLRLARDRWSKSDGIVGYLGEWHTHPEPLPSPSFVDKQGWKRLSASCKQPLIHIIVGTEELRCWLCDERGSIHSIKQVRRASHRSA